MVPWDSACGVGENIYEIEDTHYQAAALILK